MLISCAFSVLSLQVMCVINNFQQKLPPTHLPALPPPPPPPPPSEPPPITMPSVESPLEKLSNIQVRGGSVGGSEMNVVLWGDSSVLRVSVVTWE